MDDLTSQEAYLYDYRMNITSLVDQGDSEVANRTKILDDLEERIVIITDNFASSVDYFIGLNIFLLLDLNFLFRILPARISERQDENRFSK